MQRKAAMNGLATFLPPGDRDPARPVSTSDAVVTGVDRPAVDLAGDVMTRDPDRVAGSDTLVEVAGRMRTLLVAFLPVCDQHGDLQGMIAPRGSAARHPGRRPHRGHRVLTRGGTGGHDRGG